MDCVGQARSGSGVVDLIICSSGGVGAGCSQQDLTRVRSLLLGRVFCRSSVGTLAGAGYSSLAEAGEADWLNNSGCVYRYMHCRLSSMCKPIDKPTPDEPCGFHLATHSLRPALYSCINSHQHQVRMADGSHQGAIESRTFAGRDCGAA